MSPLRVVFMGSPDFAVPSLEVLLATEQVVGVVTQPDRPKGRGRALAAPPVKVCAATAGVPVVQPERIKGNEEFFATLEGWRPELIVVVAYGRILPPRVLALPPHGCLNVHGSILPKYRGAAPIQWALARGERETGVTIMRMDAGMDTGPMLLVRRQPIADADTAGTLFESLARLGAEALRQALVDLKAGGLVETPQEDAGATYAPMLKKEQGVVDFAQPARAVRDWIRAMDPWPGASTTIEGGPLRLFGAKLISGGGAAGVVMGADRDGLLVGCGEGAIAVGELQLPGGKRMPARALLAGRPIPTGTRLG
jgi:methionyl-tRNA formyltransferase